MNNSGKIASSSELSSREEIAPHKTVVIHPSASFAEDLVGKKDVITKTFSSTADKVLITGDVDEAMKLVSEAKEIVLTPEEDGKLVRKIDFCMFPLMCLLYAIQFMDKITTSSAAVMGLVSDLSMHGTQYSWVGSAFYFGYLGGLFILPPLMQKTRYLMKTVSAIIVLWGMILALHSVPSINYASFVFLRCLLGFLESAITPAFTIVTAQYWKKEEQFLRICIWFSFNGFGGIWGCALAYGLFTRQRDFAIEAWKIVFIITGCITIFVGVLMAIHLPDSPEKAWFLSRREKLMVVQRIRGNHQGFGNHHFKQNQFIEAMVDPRTWLYFLYSFASDIPNGGMTNFMSLLFKEDFGFTTGNTLLMNMAPAAVEWVSIPVFGLLSYYCYSRKFRILESRILWSTFTQALAFLGTCLLAFAEENKQARLAGVCLMYIAPVAFICTLASISANTLGSTKKWTVSSINLLGYCAGNIVGPQTFKKSPYTGAKIAMVVCSGACLFILLALYTLNVKENQRRSEAFLNGDYPPVEDIEFADLTDYENPYFRYTL